MLTCIKKNFSQYLSVPFVSPPSHPPFLFFSYLLFFPPPFPLLYYQLYSSFLSGPLTFPFVVLLSFPTPPFPYPFISGSPTVVMRCFIICVSQLLIEREFRLSPGSSVRELPWEMWQAYGGLERKMGWNTTHSRAREHDCKRGKPRDQTRCSSSKPVEKFLP